MRKLMYRVAFPLELKLSNITADAEVGCMGRMGGKERGQADTHGGPGAPVGHLGA